MNSMKLVFNMTYMAFGDSKDLTRRTASDNILRDRTFSIAKNPKYDRYQQGLASVAYKACDKKSSSLTDKSASGGCIKKENISNK